MKNQPLFLLLFATFFLQIDASYAQCTGSYVYTQLNWDKLDYFYNSGSGGVYSGYISNAKEQTQRLAFGRNSLTIATSNTGLVTTSENSTHTGDVSTLYSGADVEYTGVTGATITLTFTTAVQNISFSLYDVDDNMDLEVDAFNGASAQNVNVVTYASTGISVSGNNTTNVNLTSNTTNHGTSSNRGTATFTVTTLSNRIVITISDRGDDPQFWLSDINACVNNGNFPTNWHQGANNRPFVGPTQNMPDYFLVTPDSDSTYYVDPATGSARFLFRDNSRDYVNSFGYDPYNQVLYYVSENSTATAGNKQLKKYDYNTETYSQVLADVDATLNIPVFSTGVESAAAAYYDNCLYFGVEGGGSRESIIWRIEFTGTTPTSAWQVYATDVASGSTSAHDWGDFIIKNGVLYNFNTARNGSWTVTYTQSKYHHFNMVTGEETIYNHPGGSTLPTTIPYNGQSGMTWAGGLYYSRDSVGLYNENGTNNVSTKRKITIVDGPYLWPGGSGDASDPFRPKCDFGDAPASYDPYANPASQSPAVHERSENIRLGATWDREYFKKGVTGTNDTDDGLLYTNFMPQGSSNYLAQVHIYNNSGSNARVIAWLDYNGNGIFDASETAQQIPAGDIPSSASTVTRYLYWPSFYTPLVNGQSTYLRIRITSASAGMTTAHATGYFTNGEVEDYRVIVDNYVLSTHLLNFDAILQDNKVKLNWISNEDNRVETYEIERSSDNTNWNMVASITARNVNGSSTYQSEDNNPLNGVSFYRIKVVETNGTVKHSAVRTITRDKKMDMVIAPNPAKIKTTIRLESSETGTADIRLLSIKGELIDNRTYRVVRGSNTLELVFPSHISAGTYFVRAIMGQEEINKQLIITK
jgi:hypothetical protein